MKRVLFAVYAVCACVSVAIGIEHLAASRADTSGAPLLGLWSQFDGKAVADPLRFYYFHDGGIGLYRYGKVGLNKTNSFDWKIDDDRVLLAFRKTGERYAVPFRIEREGDVEWLVLQDDPRGPGEVRYRHQPPPPKQAEVAAGPAIGGRLWIDQKKYATGGVSFSMYQLNAGAIDGRGVGWFHEGDWDDWSTEALGYRVAGDRLELTFLLSDEPAATRFTLQGSGEGRVLTLLEDPRDFWHRHALRDGGPSFGSFAAPLDVLSRRSAGLDFPAERR